jgi:hypothetical protein
MEHEFLLLLIENSVNFALIIDAWWGRYQIIAMMVGVIASFNHALAVLDIRYVLRETPFVIFHFQALRETLTIVDKELLVH